MKVRLLGSTFCVLALLGLVGCNRESPKGGPGADKANKGDGKSTTSTTTGAPGTTGTTSTTTTTNAGADTFTIKVPAGNSNVTQGEQKEMTVSVSRQGGFDQDVTLSFKPAADSGVTVTPSSAVAKKGGDDVRVTVKAASDATVGTTNVEVMGTPATGKATSEKMGIEVKKKS